MENKIAQAKKKTQLSIILRDPVEKLNRSGINCIKYEHNSGANVNNKSLTSHQNADRLFTAGRDSIIRVYTNLVHSSLPKSQHDQQAHNFNSSSAASLNDVSLSSTASSSSSSISDHMYQMSLSHHTDWVNDIVICKRTKTVFSASSDSTVKIWNSVKGTLSNTLRLHQDYVKCLSYAKDKEILASAGFDKNIFIWDINTGVALNPNGVDVKTISENKYSIYSLVMNNQGTVLASGSPENCIRLWDPRTCAKSMKLKGHTHNIRYLLLDNDGTHCLSASSDNTIRLWSLGQQRCISTIEIHTGGVWTMCVNDSFNKVYSGGKDCKIYSTDLANPEDSVLICEETSPVLSIDFGYEQESLWVATTSSSIKNWSLKAPSANLNYFNEKMQPQTFNSHTRQSKSQTPPKQTTTIGNNVQNLTNNLATITSQNSSNKSSSSSLTSSLQIPLNTQPTITIKGTASIKHYHILNDKRYVVTKDSDDNVCVWDVLQARKTESLGKENYENAIKIRQRFISIPNWFTVDLKLGVLTINLDESDWYSAWINFRDMDSNHVRQTQNIDLSDAKVNYGCVFLESLFKNCLFIYPFQVQTCTSVIVSQNNTNTNNIGNGDGSKVQAKENFDETNQPGLLRFNIPEHITIIFNEVAGRALYRIEVKEMSRESEQNALSNAIPSWISDALLGKTIPKFNRLVFVLNPYNQVQSKVLNKDRLSSIDLLQVKKLKEHVYQKILKLDDISQQNDTNNNNNNHSNNVNSYNNTSNNNNSILNQYSNSINLNSSNEIKNAQSTDLSTLANKSIELICSEQILSDPEMNLRTIKNLIWKGSGDLTILFRVK